MKLLIIILCGVFCSAQLYAQTAELLWVKQIGGDSFEDVQAITTDNAGNIYTTGYFSTTTDFDPGPGVFNLTAVEDEDVFVCKMDSTGSLIWVKQFGGIRHQTGKSIAVDANGNVYTGGIFFGTVDFDPGPGTYTFQSNGFTDNFICKLNSNGDFVWAKQIAGTLTDRLNDMTLAKDGGIVITGYFDGTTDFDPGPGTKLLTSVGVSDIFILKLTANGQFVWVKQIGDAEYEAAYGIESDATGNLYLCGFFLGVVDFDPGPGINMLSAVDKDDIFILKLDIDGNFIWVKQMGGIDYDRATSLSLDPNGNVIITGNFVGDCDFDPGPAVFNIAAIGIDDAFIAKLDSNGIFKWAGTVQGPTYQRLHKVVTDYSGDVYAIGFFDGDADFDPGAGTFNLSAVGNTDVFLLKLDKNGNFVWAKQFGGDLFEAGYALHVDRLKNIYSGGYFRGTVDFDADAGVYNLTSNGINDIFIHKMKQCPAVTNLSLSVTTCNSYTLNGQIFTASGNYTQVLLNAEGCDSLITDLQLTITRIITDVSAVICDGETYLAGGIYQTTAGVYYDTLLNNIGCDSVIATHLTVKPAPMPDLGPDRNLCFGESLLLNPGNFSNYLWHDGSTSSSFTINNTGKYWVSIVGTNLCVGTDTLNILAIDPLPANFLNPTEEICPGNNIRISVPGYKNYLWNDNSTANALNIIRPGLYYLTVTDDNGCRGTDSVNIVRRDCIPIGIPNSFTPNGDAKNDIFKPTINQTVQSFYFAVFSRSGQKVFETREYGRGWDGKYHGKDQAQGAYVYHIKFTNGIGWEAVENGSVLLIR